MLTARERRVGNTGLASAHIGVSLTMSGRPTSNQHVARNDPAPIEGHSETGSLPSWRCRFGGFLVRPRAE
jgi:hypothetical protein